MGRTERRALTLQQHRTEAVEKPLDADAWPVAARSGQPHAQRSEAAGSRSEKNTIPDRDARALIVEGQPARRAAEGGWVGVGDGRKRLVQVSQTRRSQAKCRGPAPVGRQQTLPSACCRVFEPGPPSVRPTPGRCLLGLWSSARLLPILLADAEREGLEVTAIAAAGDFDRRRRAGSHNSRSKCGPREKAARSPVQSFPTPEGRIQGLPHPPRRRVSWVGGPPDASGGRTNTGFNLVELGRRIRPAGVIGRSNASAGTGGVSGVFERQLFGPRSARRGGRRGESASGGGRQQRSSSAQRKLSREFSATAVAIRLCAVHTDRRISLP